jgi:hypothetical protein
MKNLSEKIRSHQGLLRLSPHQKKPLVAVFVGMLFMIGAAVLLWSMGALEVLDEAPRLFSSFGETYLYFFLLGLGGFSLFIFGLVKLLFFKDSK